MPTQKRNPEMVDLLSADFPLRNEPNVAWVNALSALVNLPGVRAVWPMSANLFAIPYVTSIYGSMYAASVIAVVIGDNNPTEVEDAGEDGWTAGELNLVTFPTGGTEHYLTITRPGIYEILWNMSFHLDTPGANVEIHGGVMVGGVATMNNGEAHRTVANTSDTGNMGAPCIADLPNGNEEISLWIQNATNTANIDVVHATVTIKRLRGT